MVKRPNPCQVHKRALFGKIYDSIGLARRVAYTPPNGGCMRHGAQETLYEMCPKIGWEILYKKYKIFKKSIDIMKEYRR
jgi:hypothetical protein